MIFIRVSTSSATDTTQVDTAGLDELIYKVGEEVWGEYLLVLSQVTLCE